jgi:tRNA threonylcarbamoyl adenosine modification protein (Sua5/YciO/YrdC/YwlC family)
MLPQAFELGAANNLFRANGRLPMPEVLDWQSADPRVVLQRSVRLLAEGRLVAFPTETAYGVAAWGLSPEAVALLPDVADRGEEPALSVAVRCPADALDWAPAMSSLARRLARRCWPGPVRFVLGPETEQGVASRLPETVRQRVWPGRTLSLCMPGHDALLHTLRLLPGPLVLAGGPAATTAEQVVQALGETVSLVIDDGPSPYGAEATVVRLDGDRWRVARAGAFPAAALEQLSPCRIVFVCTGNTCRSPLAEALCKKLLADRLGCCPEDLPARGFSVHSAGLAAMMGGEAAPEAVEVARELGADLTGHRSQPLTSDLVAQADYLIAMTRSHVRALAAHVAGIGPEPRLLSGAGDDLADPVGCDQAVYRDCAHQILRHLEHLLPEFQQL